MTTAKATPKKRTTAPKFKEGDYVSATIHGMIANDIEDELMFRITDGEDWIYLALDEVENLAPSKSPTERLNLPTKAGSLLIVDPENKQMEIDVFIRGTNKEYPWTGSGMTTFSDEEMASFCIKYGYKVMQ